MNTSAAWLPSTLWPRKSGLIDTSCLSAGRSTLWLAPVAAHRAVSEAIPPSPPASPSDAVFSSSIADQIYGQVHLFPRLVEMGLLLSAGSREVVLWNATRQTVALEQIAISQPGGSTLSGIEPGTLTPTIELRGTLTIGTDGPAQQHTIYTLKTSKGEYTLTVTASRVLLFPFWPNWGTGIRMEYTFDTVIARNEDGCEQRRSLAIRPLRSLRASIWGSDLPVKPHGQRLRNLMQQGKDRVYGVPLWQEAVSVSGVDASGHILTLGEDITAHWNLTRLCDLVMLHDTKHDVSLATSLASVDPEQRTATLIWPLTTLPGASDQTGITTIRLVPLFLGIMSSAEPVGHTDTLDVWDIAFQELAGSQPPLHPQGKIPSLWPYKPDWSQPPTGTIELVRTLRTVRGGIMEQGRRFLTGPASFHQAYLLSRAETASLLDTVTAVRGRWSNFSFHDPRPAFTLTRPALPDQTELYVQDNGFADVPGNKVRLWIDTGTSPVFSRNILGVAAGDPGELVLHLDEPHRCSLPLTVRIGREHLVRLASDTLTLEHPVAAVSRCEVGFAEIG